MTDEMKSKLYWKKHMWLFKIGAKHKMVGLYSDRFIENLRDVYYGGIPASIILLDPARCRGKCYDRAILAAAGLKDFDYKVVHADIDSIRYNKNTMAEVAYWKGKGEQISERYANHCYLEFEDGGLTWVLDTTEGLVYEKHLYQLINRPKVNCVRTKEETLAFPDYIDIVEADIDRDKYIVPTLLPIIEAEIEKESLYQEQARREIELFKKKINYDALCAEIEDDKRRRGIIS